MPAVRLLIASAPHRDTFGYSMPPPGLLRLGAMLESKGRFVRLEDLAYRLGSGELQGGDALADSSAAFLLARIEAERIEVLGLSVMGATVPIALAILERIRAVQPHLLTLMGGPGTTGIDTLLLERFPQLDVVVRGEAEQTLFELLDAAPSRSFARITGLTHREGDGRIVREADRAPIADLATLPGYAWHLLPPIAAYKRITGEEDGLVPLDSGRGCVYDCSFCTIGRYWNRRSRPLPAHRLADEIAALRAIPGARQAYLCHDLFAANRAHALELCAELQARGNPLPWEVRARADHLDAELLRAMGAAGCYRALLGIESADPAVRRRNQKGMREDIDLLRVVDDCAAAGIVPILSLILGLPGEDEASLRLTLDFCARAARRTGVQLSLHLVNPQPGCGLGEEFGAAARPIEGIPPDMAFGAGEGVHERALIAAHPDLFTTWALLPQEEARLRFLHRIATELPEVLMRYPRTWQRMAEQLGGLDTLELWQQWKQCGSSFEAFALRQSGDWIHATLLWEQAQVRAGARGPDRPAERLRLACDPTREELNASPTVLAVRSDRGRIATMRLSADIDRVLAIAENGTQPIPPELLARLREQGLVS